MVNAFESHPGSDGFIVSQTHLQGKPIFYSGLQAY